MPLEFATRWRRVVVDSRTRDRSAYPTPARYEVGFDEDLHAVKSVRLVVADVPFASYLVGDGPAGAVPLAFGGGGCNATTPTATVVQLPPGDYASPQDMTLALADAIQASVGGIVGGPSFSTAYIPRTDSFAVMATEPFSIPFAAAVSNVVGNGGQRPPPSPSLARVLGFAACQDYVSTSLSVAPLPNGTLSNTSSAAAWASSAASGVIFDDGNNVPPPPPPPPPTHAVMAPYRRDFRPDRYLCLRLCPNAEVLSSVSQAIDRTFAVIPRGPFTDLCINNTHDAFEKRWSPPLGRIGKLVMTFTDAYGQLYDFQNQDHRLEFLFECVGQPVGSV